MLQQRITRNKMCVLSSARLLAPTLLTKAGPVPSLQLVCPHSTLVHAHPVSSAQLLLQPSPLTALPSSQASSPASFPSPQAVAVHVSGVVNEPQLQE